MLVTNDQTLNFLNAIYNCTSKLNTWWWIYVASALETTAQGKSKRVWINGMNRTREVKPQCCQVPLHWTRFIPSPSHLLLPFLTKMYKLVLKSIEKIKGYRWAKTTSERQTPRTPGLSVKWLCCGLLANERTEGPTDDTGGPPDADEPRGHLGGGERLCFIGVDPFEDNESCVYLTPLM